MRALIALLLLTVPAYAQMFSYDAGQLHAALAAVCPIERASVGLPWDKSTWGYEPSAQCTPEQIAELKTAFDNIQAPPEPVKK